MSFRYVSVDEAIAADGLRMVVVGGVPSPWGEAAKGILHVKGIDWLAVRLAHDSEALKAWAGQISAPVAIFGSERPRPGWDQILLLAERLAPSPSLLPASPAMRALAFGYAHEVCGEEGLAWMRRLQLVHAGLEGKGGFPPRVAKYLAARYGYRAEAADGYGPRVAGLLRMLAARLAVQRAAGSRYYVGEALTAVDIYSAACINMFAPLPPEQCTMDPGLREVFGMLDAATAAALDPLLVEHRDSVYADHLERPLSL